MTQPQSGEAETSSPSQEAPSPAQQSQAEFKDRVAQSLERALTAKQSAADEGDVVEEDDAPAPKGKPSGSPKPAAEQSKPKSETEKSGSGSKEKTEADTESESDGGERPQPRYDSRSFSKWVTNNPEKAADLAAKVFKVQLGDNADKWKTHFISAENKRRRTSEQQEKEREAFEAEKAEVRKVADDTLAAVQPILDIVEAEQKNDFPAIDLFIETTFGMSFNEYCAKRLRGNSKESTAERAAKLKAEKLEKELADLKAGKKAEPEKKEASERPTVSAKWIDKGVPEDHDVRELADWGKRVQEAYADSYDEETEDYSLSVEEAADKVYKSWLKKRMPAAEETAKPKAKPKPKPKAKREDDDEEERTPAADVGAYQTDYQERVRLALKRAESRR